MIKGLYDIFAERWYHGGTIWFYSDPHFADEEMKYIRKNYVGDDEQIRRINSKVGKNDTLVILGDLGEYREQVRQLKGYHVLVLGNHDHGASKYYRKDGHIDRSICPPKWVSRDNGLFDEVYEGPVFISKKIVLSHEPINFPYALNIHGHDHSKWNAEDIYHWNVCAEHIDYTPVGIKEIVNSGRLSKIDDIHRVTIDRASNKSE